MPQLETLSKTGQPPKTRLGSASDAYNFVDTMLDSDILRSQNRAKVDGMFDGLSPESYSKRSAKGRGGINVNFRQATAIFNQVRAPYFDTFSEVPVIAIPRIGIGNNKERLRWGQIVAQGFQRMLNSWGQQWQYIIQMHQNVMIKHGIGFCYWPDEWDWRPDAGKAADILVPDGSPSNIDEIDVIALMKEYTANQMYQFIKNPKEAEELGWNIKATRKAIMNAYNGGDNPPKGQQSWEWYEAKIKNADIYAGNNMFDRVPSAHVLVREFNGKISHNIIRYDINEGNFLFQKFDRFDRMRQAVNPFIYDIGTGTWHSINGLGKEIYPYIQVLNKTMGQWLQAAAIAGSAIMQPENAQAEYIGGMHTFDGMTIMPPNWKMVEHSIGTNLAALKDIMAGTTQTLMNNIGALMKAPNSPSPRKGQKQAIMELQQIAQLSKTNISRYSADVDGLLSEMGRRACASKPSYPGGDIAQEFKQWCMDRDVPKEVFEKGGIESWRMYRAIGAGSAANEESKIGLLQEMMPELPTEGQQRALHLILARTVGTDEANAIMGNEEEEEQQHNNDSIAAMENGFFRMGMPIPISDGQDDVVHIDSHENDIHTHMQEGEEAAKEAGQYSIESLQSIMTHLQVGLPHIKAHLDRIKNNPIKKKDYDRQNKIFNQQVQLAKQVQSNLQQMQEAQAQRPPAQPQGNPEVLKQVDYKTAPEATKMAIEQLAGLPPRQPGELSVAAENVELKKENTALKAQHQQHSAAVKDVQLSQEIKNNANQPAAVS